MDVFLYRYVDLLHVRFFMPDFNRPRVDVLLNTTYGLILSPKWIYYTQP